jgi:UDP-glucose 4-epimerase
MKILVTGAAGFIGSVVTQRLVEQGHDVTAMDNLCHGHRQAVHPKATFVNLDLLDRPGLDALLESAKVDAVVHLAAEALIDESIRNPGRFYRANVIGGINLLDAMAKASVKRIVFSSTAAVYGEPREVPVREDAVLEPVNSYGESKLAFERALAWYGRAHDLRHISFRYFNACGATDMFGEARQQETHIIPLLFEVAMGKRKEFRLFGTNYDTPDGTCVRDYVHASDIAAAHILALAKIDAVKARAFNLGNGNGFSNKQVIQAVQEVTGCKIPTVADPPRPGDPARLVASSARAREELSWSPQYAELTSMVKSAWDWRMKHPGGYES